MTHSETDPVRRHTPQQVNERLDAARVRSVDRVYAAGPDAVARRLRELDTAWDIERVLAANAATLTLVLTARAAARPSRSRLAAAALVPAFLLQHALQGWCPPVPVFRRLGLRTRGEIDAERTALKALREDFNSVSAQSPAVDALAAAGRR